MPQLRKHAEFLVVGAGAAGCTLAWLLRQAGRKVLLLELRDAREKDKLCGGVLSDDVLRVLEDVFGSGSLAELEPLRSSRLRSRCLDHEIVSNTSFTTLPRKRLDDWLLARCLVAGGELADRMRLETIDERTHVVTCVDLRDGEAMRIDYDTIVGADGASSAVRRLLTGRSQRLAVSAEGYVPPTGSDIVLAYHPAQMGYCWYIPADEVANVGCMLYEGSVAAYRAWLADFCEGVGTRPSRLRGAPIPTGDDVALRVGREAWLVGDAAGLAWPTNGGGILYAFESARSLATSLLGGVPYEDAMSDLVDSFERAAAGRDAWYFAHVLRIARHGQAWDNA